MKKLLTFALALTMALSMTVTAFAADTIITPGTDGKPNPSGGDIAVEFTVAPTYTVTIPGTVELEQKTAADKTVTYEKDLTVSAENIRLTEGSYIEVTLESNFALTAGTGTTYQLPYTVTVGDDTTAIATGDTVATFTTNTNEQTSTLHFAAGNPTYAGDYSDTVTFTISVH